MVEILPQCPTPFGRKSKEGEAAARLELYKTNTAPLGSKSLEENPHLIPRGIFVEEERSEYCEQYQQLVAKVGQEEGR